jgi:hypothetical protein
VLNETNGVDLGGNPSFVADGESYFLMSWVSHILNQKRE